MNKLKKLITMVVAMAMVLATGMTAFAATKTSITITDSTGTESTYVAYKLLNATEAQVAEGEDRKVAYTLNETYKSVLQSVTGQQEQADIIKYIQDLQDTAVKTFANDVYAQVKAMTPNYETKSGAFTDVDQGYYLIAETKTDGTYSLVMLATAGKDSVPVTTKEDVPTLTKKVKETNDTKGTTSGWQDGADYDIGDEVPFRLKGTLPSRYADYAKYKYVFHDTLSAGLTLNEDSVVVKVDDTTTLTKDADYTVVTGCTDGCSFEVVFDDLKTITAVTASSKITVDYTATLNENAVIGMDGNTNITKLQYSTNPYYNGSGSSDNPSETPDEPTSETPEDKVIVFTYELMVHKEDANQNPLEGAGFTLYKLNADGAYVAVGDEVKGEALTDFEFKGLDAGKYKLEETTVPSGYNKADDVEFEISATYDTDADDPTLTRLEIDKTTFEVADNATALIETTIVNVSGILLPSTGGIGTTIFYIVGALIMVAAAAFLIKNKRTAK